MKDDEESAMATTNNQQALPAGLYIIATPIGNMGDISLRALETLRQVNIIACEDTREAGKLAAAYDIRAQRLPYHEHNADEMRPRLVKMIREGSAVGLVSDAGTPLISDPGYKLVRDCIEAGVYVTTLPGASASLAALVLSGLPTDRFLFAGFLPPKSGARRTALGELASLQATLVFYETAPRLTESLADMASVLGDRPAAVVREITKKFEEARRGSLSELVAHYTAAGQPRGEIVVVVGAPLAGAGAWDEGAVDALLIELLEKEGLSVKDAAAFAASRTGLKKSEVYQRALLLRHRQEKGE